MKPSRGALALGRAAAVAFAALLTYREGREPAPPPARRLVVEISSFRFQPARLAVAPGDTVVWVNRDIAPHTVTDAAGTWDSGDLAPGSSWTHVVRADALGGYLCSYHPNMTGTIVTPDGRSASRGPQ